VETHDMVPGLYGGLVKKHPAFSREFPIAFPLSTSEKKRLDDAGLPSDINEFCRGGVVARSYCPPYWE